MGRLGGTGLTPPEKMLWKDVLLILLIPLSLGFQKFSFSPFPRIQLSAEPASPRLAKLRRMEVGQIDSNVRVDMNLIEFMFLNMDFNFLNTVPKAEKLRFKMPDI